MENITYYLGAGASYNALPLYSNFQERLQIFHDYIFHTLRNSKMLDKKQGELYLQYLERLISALNSTENMTLDILAHGLHDSQGISQIDFYNLKYLISDFFVFEQLRKTQQMYYTQAKISNDAYKPYEQDKCNKVNTHIDNRYKQFLLPLLNGTDRISKHVNFISWNYDVQAELSYAHWKGCSINLAQTNLQVYPSPETYRGIDVNSASSFIKLNGTAGIYFNDNSSVKIQNFIYEREFEMNEDYLSYMLQTFCANRTRIFGAAPFFKFYFENNSLSIKAIEYANSILKNTETLVIIGYSFHTSNRETDEQVFKDTTNIKKVVLQVCDADYQHIKYNFLKIKPDLENCISQYPTLHMFAPPNNL